MKHFPPSVAGPTGATGATGAAGPSNVIHESAGPTDLTVGAVLDGEGLRRVGTTAVGRFLAVVGPSSAVSDPGDTSNHDVTGLTVALPRAGTYFYNFFVHKTVGVTTATIGTGVSFSGSVTSLVGGGSQGSTSTQTASDVLPTGSFAPGTFTTPIAGTIVVSTPGTLAVRFNRGALGTIAFPAGGGGFVIEK